jgi:hypothetical protein
LDADSALNPFCTPPIRQDKPNFVPGLIHSGRKALTLVAREGPASQPTTFYFRVAKKLKKITHEKTNFQYCPFDIRRCNRPVCPGSKTVRTLDLGIRAPQGLSF